MACLIVWIVSFLDGETRCGGRWWWFQWQRLCAVKNTVRNSCNSIFTLQMCHKFSIGCFKGEKKEMLQEVFLNPQQFHFKSLKSTSIPTIFIDIGSIKCLHLINCFNWPWHWFDNKPKFHSPFLMFMIKLSCIRTIQRAGRSFFNVISCSLVLKKSVSENDSVYLNHWWKLKDSNVSGNSNTNGKHHGKQTKMILIIEITESLPSSPSPNNSINKQTKASNEKTVRWWRLENSDWTGENDRSLGKKKRLVSTW